VTSLSAKTVPGTVSRRALPDRVVVINDDCVSSGGAANIALTSARMLRRRGVPVTFLCGGADTNSELAALGVDMIALGGAHLMSGRRGPAALRGLFDRTTLAAAAQWCEAHDSPGTVYHLHNWHKVLSPSIFAALRPVAGRLVLSAHDYFLACPNGGFVHYPQARICALSPGSVSCTLSSCDRRHYAHKLWRLARHRLRRAVFDLGSTRATLIAVHDGMSPYLERGGIAPGAIRVLRNPVTAWRTERIPAERNRDVFFIGRLEQDKGVDLLAKAAKRAGAHLQIIGDGPLIDDLARDHPECDLLGWRSRAEIAELIGGARMVVAPTRWRETFGLVALEALMSGVPVIASRFALLSEEIVDRGLGVACDPYDEAALAAAIGQLLGDDALVEEMSSRAFATARALAPTPRQWFFELLAIYEAVLERDAGHCLARSPGLGQ
jgi:glycosyltransferase involved in cell wall biosynthesis